jgi:hypothetical protein
MTPIAGMLAPLETWSLSYLGACWSLPRCSLGGYFFLFRCRSFRFAWVFGRFDARLDYIARSILDGRLDNWTLLRPFDACLDDAFDYIFACFDAPRFHYADCLLVGCSLASILPGRLDSGRRLLDARSDILLLALMLLARMLGIGVEEHIDSNRSTVADNLLLERFSPSISKSHVNH